MRRASDKDKRPTENSTGRDLPSGNKSRTPHNGSDCWRMDTPYSTTWSGFISRSPPDAFAVEETAIVNWNAPPLLFVVAAVVILGHSPHRFT